MRAVWCFLLLLTVLAPAGSVGITTAPAEAETVLSAPRAGASLAIERRDQIETAVPVPSRPCVSPRLVTTSSVLPARPVLRSVIVTVANPRGPPA